MTPDHELDLLFDPTLIPPSCHAALGHDLHLRPLSSTDSARGHLEILSVLTAAPSLSPRVYTETFNHIKSCSKTYFAIVIVQKSTDKIVACGSMMLERKFVRSAGLVGHIEDIAVSKFMQGRKLGLRIITTLEGIGRAMGCYKIILDCSKENIAFYEKCGFEHKEFQMVRYMSDAAGTSKSTPSARL